MSKFQPRDLVKVVQIHIGSYSDLFGELGQFFIVRQLGPGTDVIVEGDRRSWDDSRFELVSRPDADGWYEWPGGENPVPGRQVQLKVANIDMRDWISASEEVVWDQFKRHPERRLLAFRIVEDVKTEVVIRVSGPSVERERWLRQILGEMPTWDAMPPAQVIEDTGPQAASPAEDAQPQAESPATRNAIDWHTGYLLQEIIGAGGVIDYEDGSVTWPEKAKITMSPDAVQEGDLVRVSFDATVGKQSLAREGTVDLAGLSGLAKHRAATIELLERPEKPLAVGDRVSWVKGPEAVGEVKGIDGDEAWVKWPPAGPHEEFDYSTVPLTSLKRVTDDLDAFAKAV